MSNIHNAYLTVALIAFPSTALCASIPMICNNESNTNPGHGTGGGIPTLSDTPLTLTIYEPQPENIRLTDRYGNEVVYAGSTTGLFSISEVHLGIRHVGGSNAPGWNNATVKFNYDASGLTYKSITGGYDGGKLNPSVTTRYEGGLQRESHNFSHNARMGSDGRPYHHKRDNTYASVRTRGPPLLRRTRQHLRYVLRLLTLPPELLVPRNRACK